MTYAKPDRCDTKKSIKKCSDCGELDYMTQTQELCDDCQSKKTEKNNDILSI